MKMANIRDYMRMGDTSIDILNDPEYADTEDVQKFRGRCKCKFPATELAFIQRGVNGEIHLLEYCNAENVIWYYGLVRQKMMDWEYLHEPPRGEKC